MIQTGNTWTAEQEATFKQPILTKYEKESHAFYSSARLWDDGIIDPADTRKVGFYARVLCVIAAMVKCMCASNVAPTHTTRHPSAVITVHFCRCWVCPSRCL